MTFTLALLEAKLKAVLSSAGSPAGRPTPSVPQTPSTPGTTSTPSVSISSVTCPSGSRPAAHASIQCAVKGTQGATGNVTVTFDNDAGTSFHYSARLQGPTVTQTVNGNSTLP